MVATAIPARNETNHGAFLTCDAAMDFLFLFSWWAILAKYRAPTIPASLPCFDGTINLSIPFEVTTDGTFMYEFRYSWVLIRIFGKRTFRSNTPPLRTIFSGDTRRIYSREKWAHKKSYKSREFYSAPHCANHTYQVRAKASEVMGGLIPHRMIVLQIL
jgi:hypothetical protein